MPVEQYIDSRQALEPACVEVHVAVSQNSGWLTERLVLYGRSMRAILIHVLAVLLIAIFTMGSQPPAKADCATCHDCSTEAPVKNDMPCPEKGLICQVAQACAGQAQKAPAQINFVDLDDAGKAAFNLSSSIAIKSAYLTPETAPPRT